MNDDGDYADALFPGTRRVFGKTLEPLSLGHALVLEQIGARWFRGDNAFPDYAETLEAVYLCSMPYEQASAAVRRPLSWRAALWARAMLTWAVLRPMWGIRSIGAFVDYLNSGFRSPKVSLRGGKGGSGSGPGMMALKVAAQRELRKTESEALSSSPGALIWELMAVAQSAGGGVSFLNDDDEDLLETAERMRKEAADVDAV